MLAQKVCGDFGRAFVVNVDPSVELTHGFVVQQVSQRLELRFEVRVRIQEGFTHHWRGGVVREVVQVVVEQLEVEGAQNDRQWCTPRPANHLVRF